MIAALVLALAQSAPAPHAGFPGLGVDHRPRVEIAWNRFYDADEIHAHFDRLAEAWPGLLAYEVIGHSVEGRELRVYTLHDPAGGAPESVPAMWVDGNVHGNEVQGAEAVLYLAWYLLENQAANPQARELVRDATWHLLPMVNPDGRASWFAGAHDAHSSRSGVQPRDDDGDGLFDEDGPNDLDGDGQIVQMRKFTPGAGDWRQDPDDPRLMERVPPNDKGIRGDWTLLGSEGFDDDGDGRVDEDERGGYDMNRSWPSTWQPEHVQGGAGPYPLCWPETRAIARYVLGRTNLAAVQSFHNMGGMILRGPGTESVGEYPREDLRVYDELGATGERMLPFYRYMVLWKDLYTVFGGFVTWTYEGLGIVSFTNEMWTASQLYPDEAGEGGGPFGRVSREDRQLFDDKLLLGAGFVPWHAVEHPLYGQVEVGGFKKDVGRVPPSFLIEEMLHRNALFCVEHARSMPRVEIESASVSDLGGGLKAVDVVFANRRAIPTRTALAAREFLGAPDVYSCTGRRVEVLAGGFVPDRWHPERMQPAERTPERLIRWEGVPGRGEVRVRWIVRGSADKVVVTWQGEKARDVTLEVKID